MKILLTEANTSLIPLRQGLQELGFELDVTQDDDHSLNLAQAWDYDLILLPVIPSDGQGIQLCQQLRDQGYQNLIVLLMEGEDDAIAMAGFDAGADDYVSVDSSTEMLLARIQTLLRRQMALKTSQPSTVIRWGDLSLDWQAGRVKVGDRKVPLTATEYELLSLLLRHPERIFSRHLILERLWEWDNAPTDRAINTYIKDLRKKLKAAGLTTDPIETIYGMGYRLKTAPSVSGEERPPSLPRAINSLEKRFIQVSRQRLAVLQQAKIHLLAGTLTPEQQKKAQKEAHQLAGSLGFFGYLEGSKVSRSLEHLLMTTTDSTVIPISHFTKGVEALEELLARSPVLGSEITTNTSQSPQVLIIDDDPLLAERFQANNERWGFQITPVPQLSAARLQLQTSLPDVVLLNLSLTDPEGDSFSLLQELTRQWPDLPVIIFTARDSLSDRLRVSKLGARQFLLKTTPLEQIFQVIMRVVTHETVSEPKILIVDDEPQELTRLLELLSPWGLAIAPLQEPQSFWEQLETFHPDLILLNQEMSGISGLELCQVVRQDAQWGDLPILVITDQIDVVSLQKAFACGADDFIAKPIVGPELITRVLCRIERYRRSQGRNPQKVV